MDILRRNVQKKNTVKDACNVSQYSSGKYYKNVTINGLTVAALIDTGSDLTLMRAEQYIKAGSPALIQREIRFRGIGSDYKKTLGEFDSEIKIDDNNYPIKIRVISDTLMKTSY